MNAWSARASRVAVLALVVLLGGCESLGYYRQAIGGQLSIMLHRSPIEKVIADESTDPGVRKRLRLIESIRGYAGSVLHLPVDDSYSTYVDIHRAYVVWNLFATPELSLEPLTWCFPVAGCVSYRGYFEEARARDYGRELVRQGNDVYIGGVAAYSTLGWFSDPVLSTFLRRSEPELAALLFHELAHKACYVPCDTTFNESFATTVEVEAVRRWLSDRGERDRYSAFVVSRKRRAEFVHLVAEYRARLNTLYQSDATKEQKRAGKRRLITEMRAAYRTLKASWGGPDDFVGWMGSGINNAKLVSLGSYNDLVPVLEKLLADEGGDLDRFLASCNELAGLTAEARRARLDSLDDAGHRKPK